MVSGPALDKIVSNALAEEVERQRKDEQLRQQWYPEYARVHRLAREAFEVKFLAMPRWKRMILVFLGVGPDMSRITWEAWVKTHAEAEAHTEDQAAPS